MSNQGVRGFYQINEKIKNQLLNDQDINTVTSGDISKINLGKQDIFPLGHIVTNSVTVQEQTLRFNLTVFAMDIVNRSKEETVDIFTGNNNEQDILNTQLAVLNKLKATSRPECFFRFFANTTPSLIKSFRQVILINDTGDSLRIG